MKVRIKKLHENAIIPEYQTEGAAGFDLHALDEACVYPGETMLIRTGLAFKIPQGYELQIRPRSGLSLKTKLRISNSPGTIDSDYRGEVKLIVDNIANKRFDTLTIKQGQRIAQAVLTKVEKAEFQLTEELDDTVRNEKGFGSSDH